MNKRSLPWWLFIASLFFILIIRDLFRDGMFMDGMLYASVANNLSNGLGTFWHPHFSKTVMTVFHEQPPLLFAIEAIFLKIFNHSIYAERIYGLLVAILTVFLIHRVWILIWQDRREKRLSWLPVLFWISIPVCFWSYANNMEEPTMGMFDLAAIIFIIKAIIAGKRVYLNLFLSGIMLFAASMCKGIQGLFPLAAIFLYWISTKKISFSQMMRYSLFMVGIVICCYAFTLISEAARTSYIMYYKARLFNTFAHPATTHTDRIYILKQLFSELIPIYLLMLIAALFVRIKTKHFSFDKRNSAMAVWFLLIALSGTLPLMLTLEQSGFYMVMTFPYYAIGLSVLFASPLTSAFVHGEITSAKYNRVQISLWITLAASIGFSLYSILYISKRDKEKLHDIYMTGEIISRGAIVGVPKEMSAEWSVHNYFNRYFYISLDASGTKTPYFLIDKSLDQRLVPDGYIPVDIPTLKYNLYANSFH